MKPDSGWNCKAPGGFYCLGSGIALPFGALLVNLLEKKSVLTRSTHGKMRGMMKIDWAYLRKG
jgi:hypothetical protein